MQRRAVLVAAAHVEGVEVSEKLLPELGRISAALPACRGERAVGHAQRRRGRPHAHLARVRLRLRLRDRLRVRLRLRLRLRLRVA